MKCRSLVLICLTITLIANVPKLACGFQTTLSRKQVALTRQDGQVDILLDGELFTRLDYKTYAKPILYPIFAPNQIPMTRDWPMKADVAGQSHDHPHHKSIWIGHEINGVDFWTEKGGDVQTVSVTTEFADGTSNAALIRSNWVQRSNNHTLLTDETVYWFGGDDNSHWVNCLIDFQATHGDIVFEDTKEGLFAIRTHPDLRLTAKPDAGVEKVFGNASTAREPPEKTFGENDLNGYCISVPLTAIRPALRCMTILKIFGIPRRGMHATMGDRGEPVWSALFFREGKRSG